MERWLALARPLPDSKAVLEWIEDGHAFRASGEGVRLAVCSDTGRLLGCVELLLFACGEGTAGYWTVPSARGRGVARRALGIVRDWAFESGIVWVLDVFTVPGNEASERVALACGFVPDGLFICDEPRVGREVTFNAFRCCAADRTADSPGLFGRAL